MTEQFNLKVNLNKVSKAVKQFVADVAKTEGSKKKIDSEKEFAKLSDYLAGNGFSMSKDELGYVQGFMIEYQNKKFEDSTTENTKKEVSKIAKRMGDKKTIDTDEEAQALATMLRNTHNDLNQADIIYIKNLLIRSGYANYLPQPPQPPVQVVNVTINEIHVDDNEENKQNIGEETTNEVQEKPVPKRHTPAPKVRPNQPQKPTDPTNPTNPTPPEDKKTEKEFKIEEKDRNKGFGLADRIVHELNSHIADNQVIKNALGEVDNKNAYSFVGKFISAAKQGVNKGVFSVSDLFNTLNYRDTLHVMKVLLQQAKSIGLENTKAYNRLKEEIDYAKRYLFENPDADPSKMTIQKADSSVKNLYSEMSKVYN